MSEGASGNKNKFIDHIGSHPTGVSILSCVIASLILPTYVIAWKVSHFSLCRSRMREEDELVRKLSAYDIQNLGFDWPKYALIEEYCIMENGKVDLTRTIERVQSSRAFYKRQLD